MKILELKKEAEFRKEKVMRGIRNSPCRLIRLPPLSRRRDYRFALGFVLVPQVENLF